MRRVNVVVEGPTEESFVKNLLAERFWPLNILLTPIILGPVGHRGGRPGYARVRRHVLTLLRQERGTYCSTMLDLYGLGTDFPGMPLPPGLGTMDRVARLERGMQDAFGREFPDLRIDARLVPYIQAHEFEGLLFSDPEAFASALKAPALRRDFEDIRSEFSTPEDINDGPSTAPSKRVLTLHPRYDKVTDGTLAAQYVGIDRMREQCPHFRDWLERLQSLAPL